MFDRQQKTNNSLSPVFVINSYSLLAIFLEVACLNLSYLRGSFTAANVFLTFAVYQSGTQCDISAQLSMHNFISMQSFYISATFFILCLFYCLVSVTLVRVTDQNFYIYNKASLNIRTILIIFCQYFYGNNIFNVSFNMCLFKRVIFDVM